MVTLAVSAGLPVAAILTAGMRDVDIQPGVIDWVFVGAILIVTTAVFKLFVPWAERHCAGATIGTALAVTALLVLPVMFWTMVPVILGTAGAWLAYVVRGQRWDAVTSITVACGAIAAVGSIAGYIMTS